MMKENKRNFPVVEFTAAEQQVIDQVAAVGENTYRTFEHLLYVFGVILALGVLSFGLLLVSFQAALTVLAIGGALAIGAAVAIVIRDIVAGSKG